MIKKQPFNYQNSEVNIYFKNMNNPQVKDNLNKINKKRQ